jgi:TATA-box binding protein (TBP) (component of TFIID and TFIIIB)
MSYLNSTTSTQLSDYVKASPLRISTKVITANMGTTMNAKVLFDNIAQILIPLWWPGEGVLKMEHDKNVVGYASRDAFSKRGVSEKTFFNQSTVVVRKATNPERTQFKEVNVKLFGNGGIQMTGIPAEEFAKETLTWLIEELKKVKAPVFNTTPSLQKFKVQLINSDYQVAHAINRTTLHSVLSRNYGLFSTFESTIYQGVNTKYYFNDQHPDKSRPGICLCKKRCRGQGSGSGDGECKRITMSVFQTGKIIITGGRYLYQLEEAYNFLNAVLQRHASDVLRLPTPAEEPEPVVAAVAAPQNVIVATTVAAATAATTVTATPPKRASMSPPKKVQQQSPPSQLILSSCKPVPKVIRVVKPRSIPVGKVAPVS